MPNPVGRPPSYDVSAQAKALDEWSQKDSATALVQFCNQQDIYPDIIYDWRDRSDEFATALKKAKCRMAERLRRNLDAGTTNYGLCMSELGFHDKFYHDYVESVKDREAERRKSIEGSKATTYNIVVPNGLSAGTPVQSSTISTECNKGAE